MLSWPEFASSQCCCRRENVTDGRRQMLEDPLTGPLLGIKIVDVATAIAGPWASSLLAAHGAEVMFVERVASADLIRFVGPVVGDQSGAWVAMNGGKRAIELDIRDPRGRDVIRRLASDADVFIQNFRPGVADRLGIGFSDLSKLNPRLIYVSVSGYGTDGPYAEKPVYDPIIQGLSGMAAAQNGDFVKSFIVDKVAAMTAANSVLAALVSRAAGGEGQHIEINLLDSMLSWLWTDVFYNQALPDAEPAANCSDWYSPYATADGQIAVSWTNYAQFASASAAVGHPEFARDDRLGTRDWRTRDSRAMRAAFAGALSTMTTSDALASLRAHDVPSGPVLTREQVLLDPQVIHNEIIVEGNHPTAGRTRTVRTPAKFSSTPTAPRGSAPGKGQHTDEVLREIAMSDSDIAELRHDGVIGPLWPDDSSL